MPFVLYELKPAGKMLRADGKPPVGFHMKMHDGSANVYMCQQKKLPNGGFFHVANEIHSKFSGFFASMTDSILYFKEKVLLSLRGISMFFSIFFVSFFFMLMVKESTGYMVVLCAIGYLLVISVVIFYHGWQMCYFGISEKQLVVRNLIFFWWKRTILLTDIKSIRIDMTVTGHCYKYYSPYYLRVFFDGLKTQKFYAGTLKAKTWALLSKELKKKGIHVVNTVPYIEISFWDML